MKRIFSCIAVFILLLATASAANADTAKLPAIDEILSSGSEGGKVEVSDNLDAYSPLNDSFEDIDHDIKILFLEREGPEKEFTEKKVYPPFGDSDGFSDDFMGVDIGKSRVWLRTDLMNRIPEYFRATSLKDATYLLMAETMYMWGGTLIVSDFKNDIDETPPVFDTIEEMEEYMRTHQRVITSQTYYPVFASFSFISLYDTQTKNVSYFDVNYTEAKYFGRNREASEQWNKMISLYEIIEALDENKKVNPSAAKQKIEELEFIPEGKASLWISCIDAEEYSTAAYSIADYFWSMAEDLKNLDPAEDNRKNYDLIISEKNINTLANFVDFCDYSGFEKPISTIRAQKEYLAGPDAAWMEKAIRETIDLFNGN